MACKSSQVTTSTLGKLALFIRLNYVYKIVGTMSIYMFPSYDYIFGGDVLLSIQEAVPWTRHTLRNLDSGMEIVSYKMQHFITLILILVPTNVTIWGLAFFLLG